jgi:hypothetical protein
MIAISWFLTLEIFYNSLALMGAASFFGLYLRDFFVKA